MKQARSLLRNFSEDFNAVVIGASGGIGGAVLEQLSADTRRARAIGLSRASNPEIELTDENSMARAVAYVRATAGEVELIFDATGVLNVDGKGPEKTVRALDPSIMAKSFAINAIGPALLFKHFSELLPREQKGVIATLSARVGSIGDNHIGGWISYRASKAALNQIVRVSAIEIARKRPNGICVALHPGTVATSLSAPHSGSRQTFTPQQAVQHLLSVIDDLKASDSGGFYAYDGSAIEW